MDNDDVILFDIPVRPGGPRKPQIISDSVRYAKEAREAGMSRAAAAAYATQRVDRELREYERYQYGAL